MAWTKRHTQLNDALADLLPFPKEIRRFAVESGLRPQNIDFEGSGMIIWHNLISEANKQHKVNDLINAVLKQYPNNPYLKAALNHPEVDYSLSPELDDSIWSIPSDSELEVLTTKRNTLLPISFLEKGTKTSDAVAKVLIENGSSINVGTGFLFKIDFSDTLFFMTNYHVINDKSKIPNTRIIFNYQENELGESLNSKSFRINPNGFWATSPVNNFDVSVFQLLDDGEELSRYGHIPLKDIDIKQYDFVNIIQHPGGGMKQIALYHNIVTSVSDNKILYLTDTMKGSSGSPVFNSKWEIVALHHAGGSTKIEEYTAGFSSRNVGIPINKIIDFLKKKLK